MTLFDIVTVGCFVAMAAAYFTICGADQRLLPHFLIAGLAFAIANQLGNRGQELFAIVVILAGAGYAAYVARRGP